MAADLAEITPQKRIRLSLHQGQARAWQSTKRFVAIIAGTQSGKTSFGPHWLYREIQLRGPGDYLIASPTFALLEKKAIPELRRVFERWLKLGKYYAAPVRRFVFSPDGDKKTFGKHNPDTPTIIYFGYAEDPESLESATYKAAWLDEAGQKKFKLGSWEAILRRLSLALGRVLFTTTPYDLGWLKQRVFDRWKRSKDPESAQPGDDEYDVIRFDSTENPLFPREEFERARRDLPRWKFDLFYRGIFTRPAGLIYDNFSDEYAPFGQKVTPFDIPREWPRYLGIDFGGVNTAALFYAEDPATRKLDKAGRPLPGTGKLYLYREYKAGSKTAAMHSISLRLGEPGLPTATVGGSKSEGQWRAEFAQSGLPVMQPAVREVEVGINRVYAAHAEQQILVFDTCTGYLEQKTTYSREVDENGDPTDEIEDKETFHFLDAERYIIGYLRNSGEVRMF